MYEDVERDLVADIARQVVEKQAANPLDAMRTGARLFLDGFWAPDAAQIVLIDTPAVLGWVRRHEVGRKIGLGEIEGMLAVISRAKDRAAARREMDTVCYRLLRGIAGR